MRIVIPMLHYYPDRPSGSVRLAFDEAVFLAELGHEVWVITQDASGSKLERSFEYGIEVLRYPSPRFTSFDPRRIWAHQEHTRNLLLRYIGRQVDLVHGHSLLHYHGALGVFGASGRMCYSVHSPVFLEMRAGSRGASKMMRLRLWITAYFTHWIERDCLKRSDCITADSSYTKSMLERLHGPDIGQRVQVIPGWVDLERFTIASNRRALKSELGWPLDIPVFFSLRRLVPRMGLDRLISALDIVKRAGYRFHMVVGGSGPLHERLQALVEQLGLKDCIHLVGFVPEDLLPSMYAAADAFVLPTAELECFGLIALEALACGRPVLATPVAAIPEVMHRFDHRWLAEDSSVDAIAQLLVDYLNGELPVHEPDTLREIVARHYSRQCVLEQLISATLDFSMETSRSRDIA